MTRGCEPNEPGAMKYFRRSEVTLKEDSVYCRSIHYISKIGKTQKGSHLPFPASFFGFPVSHYFNIYAGFKEFVAILVCSL